MFAYLPRSVFIAATLMCFAPLGGCANYIFETFNTDTRGDSISMDAKQRVLLVTHEGGKTRDRKIVCAEPSPDAYSVSAASASGSIAYSVPGAPGANGAAGTPGTQGGGGLSGGRNETGASLAMRTQTVQLLRDGLYRACEAYMNGAIDQFQYNVLLVNMDRLMTTLMGIDAIAGTQNVAPSAITAAAVGTSSKTTSADGKVPGVDQSTTAGTAQAPFVSSVTVQPAGVVQSEAIANVILAAHSHSATPALCVSLLASGEMRLDNPGQSTVLRSCDYLLNGLVRKTVADKGDRRAPTAYKVSDQASNATNGTPSGKKASSTGTKPD